MVAELTHSVLATFLIAMAKCTNEATKQRKILGSLFMNAVHCVSYGTVTGVGGSWPRCIYSREAKKNE